MNLGLIAVVSLIFLGMYYQARRRKRAEYVRGRAKAFELVKLLRRLLEHTQRHRGLCFGVMSGESILDGERWASEQQVLAILTEAQEFEASLKWYDSWQQAAHEWDEIQRSQAEKAPAETVLVLHHQMIGHLLDVVRAIAIPHDLVPLGALSATPAGSWLELLEHTELVGKARAIGTGIAAHRQNTSSQRHELARLRQLLSKQPYECLAQLDGDPELRPLVNQAVMETERRLDLLLDLIDKLLAAAAGKSVHSAVYFRTATQAINGLLGLVDLLLDRLELPSQA
ncbi:Nitrate and nitrite sensing [Halopseudomonas xinjiangensis]|uniref:Nitrate and nitrite sensing n=1 Tax=Halopseudomonas xinjiangensis TaxID=487184 RepID=A0A1H1P1R0_9GAMM|nr:nitrate- and nitrite sensing domain-containing protein [Halopseudomonas xinjiangensis]SDS05161.1 Nitrate and nitrite sensing [Halopseudomonas xinjiangensis]